ncbi:zonular occludens toxin domain-containing protein [Shewanella marina]|uniref:zonular occludens toxin domain-containing protein n=1 Tax=Shewanella marina TaxID=487319 RepID=UPI00046EC216|nr:zonular occludens toxin domain-containing protein [Shewanella marina]
MAVSFRHGGNGSYKSAYAVWFEVLPALRAGRLVVTNIEGLKSLESIEKLLGEKFPSSARLIRIFSRSVEGVELWQNWFSWMPIGALIIIDECQDLFTKKVGFNMEKVNAKPIDVFLPYLPKDFNEYFYSRWQPQDPTKFDDGDVDDTGRTQLDENNRLLYPFNFYGAFMRHRKYQWDIVMLTPDWTAIDTSLRGCAQNAYGHRSTDTFFRKRRPRIFSHLPNTTSTKPSKSDAANVTSIKIPLEVFALYKSTGTGSFNASLADLTMLKQPKLLLALIIFLGGLFAVSKGAYDLYFGEAQTVVSAATQASEANQAVSTNLQAVESGLSSVNQTAIQGASSVGAGNDFIQTSSVGIHPVNVFTRHFPNFDKSTAVYIAAVNKVISSDASHTDFLFRFDSKEFSQYLSSDVLSQLGYSFKVLDDCVISVSLGNLSQLVICPPVVPEIDSSDSSPVDIASDTALPSLDIFGSSES